jgi:SWIM zinc finger
MAKASVADSVRTPETREQRGLQLWEDHADEITHENGVWLVPSQHDATSVYEVTIGRRGESCECEDFEHRGQSCKHIHAATIAKAKTTPCSCCGQRVPGRFVTEVQEEHGLLAWFVGDRLCADCIHAGHWA